MPLASPSVIVPLVGGFGVSGGGISSSNISRLPIRETMPRLTTCADSPDDFTASTARVVRLAVEQPADHVRPARVAELEADEHLVADLGQEQVPHSLPMPNCTTRAQSVS